MKCRRLLTKHWRVDNFGSMIQLCLISTEYVFTGFIPVFQLFPTFLCFQNVYLPFLRSLWRTVVVEHGYERRKRIMKDSQFPSLSLSGGAPSSPTTALYRCSRAAAKASSSWVFLVPWPTSRSFNLNKPYPKYINSFNLNKLYPKYKDIATHKFV